MSKKTLVGGTIILIITGFIVRVLGFVYRIYLSNLIGAEGMGLFQLIFPIYSVIIITLSAGISIAVSKMVAEEVAKQHIMNIRRITRLAFVMVVSAGLIVSVLFYFNLNFVVNSIIKDSRTYYSLILLIPCIPIIAAASALKGYFYGIQNITPTAFSQVAEQIVRIAFVMIVADRFLGIGLEYACAVATLGMALGEIANLAVLYIAYKLKKNKIHKNGSNSGLMRKRFIIKELLTISFPISLNRFITNLVSAFETILIPSMLVAGGMAHKLSMQEFGRLTGMAMPVIFFPSLVTSSLATLLVPAISEGISVNNYKSVNYRISKSIQLTIALGVIFTALFICYPNEIGNLMYKKEKIGDLLYSLAFASSFLYLQQVLFGILNGLGKQGISLRNSLISYAIRIGFVYLAIPAYGLTGYVWGLVASSIIVCILNMITVVKCTEMKLDLQNWAVKPLIIGIIMLFSGKYIYSFFGIFNIDPLTIMLLTISGNISMGVGLTVVLGLLRKNELMRLVGLR